MTGSTPRAAHRLTTFAMALALALAGLALAACEGVEEREPVEVGTEQMGTETGELGEPAAGDEYFGGDTGTGTPAALGTASVEVRLHGRTIEMPATLPPGETTFVVTNTGEHEHNFEIEGQGIEEELASNLQPGETGELTVTLQPGSYTVYCPVADHRAEGMVTTLTVAG